MCLCGTGKLSSGHYTRGVNIRMIINYLGGGMSSKSNNSLMALRPLFNCGL